MESIRAESVVKSFGSTLALDGITLEIEPGELFFLLGASGCGKTTLLRCIAGLETPTRGSIFFGERDVTKMPPHKREAAMVFQSYALWPHLNVAQNVAFGLEERNRPQAEIEKRVEQALDLVKLSGLGARRISQLSGGQQQRVAIARSLANDPLVILADEATGNLDSKTGTEVMNLLLSVVAEEGKTLMVVTHDTRLAAQGDRMLVLRDGMLVD